MARTPSVAARTSTTSPPPAGAPTAKRKRPPTFQHFPINRAAKLKQAWVQNAKLKSKWKAEKRKLGLGAPPKEEDEADDDAEQPEARESETSTHARAPIPPPPPKKRTRRAQFNPTEAESSGAPTLRDRAREAYSQTSLHTYKSDPFGKRQRGAKTGTVGRGQPNMKKRMDVLLETIKRDFT
ncbi:hypothetical protein FB451DRAFT_1038155 [Mycena latifolia]|nr:hypothetical protein FB451DRAFT_1038155 [Mycena latifolia]